MLPDQAAAQTQLAGRCVPAYHNPRHHLASTAMLSASDRSLSLCSLRNTQLCTCHGVVGRESWRIPQPFASLSTLRKLFVGGARGSGILPRSEEHTSELQSLMRISYAVFCLKKKQ